MAILRTTVNYFVRGSATLQLTPNSPVQRELVDTYSVRLWIHDKLVYDHIQSVRNWQMRHYYVQQIAKGFCVVRQLLGQRINFTEEQGDNDNEQQESLLSFVTAELSTDWLTVYLKAADFRGDELVHANVLLRKSHNEVGSIEHDREGQWGEWDDIVVAWFFCRPNEAIAFGKQLLEEIEQAERVRVELGIPDYDETD